MGSSLIDDPAKVIAWWLAMLTGRPDVALAIATIEDRPTTLRLVVSGGRRLDEPISITRVR